LVSVLFADLVGFTTLSESRDSEEVREILSRYFETSRMLIERYGGVVEKFIGDAVMAVWGTPVAKEDDAERAVRAALELVDAVAQLGADLAAPDLRARAGVLTGEVTVNLGVTGQGMVAGDAVNTASRIQSAAEPGTVLVAEATRRATEAAVAYDDAGEQQLKGKKETVRLSRALRVTAGRGGLMKSEGLEPPFVGRDREMKLVKDLFHACVEESKAHLVQVTGIAGIGKSRLGWEFFKYMDGLERLFFWHRGRCLAYGEGVTYWALAEMVRGRAGILEGEDRSSALIKLHEAVERYVQSPEDRAFVKPRLAHLIGLEDRVASDKTDLFAGWRLFFERLTDQDPVLMVFEDLQWADASLLEFIDYLLEWSRSHPIFVMALARPGAETAPLAASRRNATSIYLEPLPQGAMQSLLTGLVPGLPPELTEQILARAEGVPLYAVETVRMLLDRGLLVQDGPYYRPVGPIDALDVPETLHGLIAARLDGLRPEERRLVQDASVLGKTFTRAALAALSGLPERDLDPLLASLVAKEVLSVQADPRSPERGQYGFLQDLVRTVAYETLAKRDRKTKHLEVAHYLEQAWGQDEEEIVEVVASHYVEAYRLAPEAEDSRAIRDQARRMLVRAADRAASLAAAEEAESYFRRAAELTDSALERAELVERAGEMAHQMGHPDDATASFEEATRLFADAGQTHPAARVQARLAEVEFERGFLEQGIERMQRSHAVLSADEPDPDRALVAAQLGRFLAVAGRYEEALPALDEALELAEHLELRETYSHALSSKAIGLIRLDRLDEASTLLQRALEVALEHGFLGAAFRAYNNLSVVYEAQDRVAEMLELNRQALELARRAGDRVQEVSWLTGALATLLLAGEWDLAQAWADEARRTDELMALEMAAGPLIDLAALHVRRGALPHARELLDGSASLATSENPEMRLFHAVVSAEVLRGEGKPREALDVALDAVRERARYGLTNQGVKRVWVQAVEAALELDDRDTVQELLAIVEEAWPGQVMPSLRGHAARFAARLAVLRGEDDPVEPGFGAAERTFRQIPDPFDLGTALAEHAAWLLGTDRDEQAGPLVAEAREIFERLQARPSLDRLDAIARSRGVSAEVTTP